MGVVVVAVLGMEGGEVVGWVRCWWGMLWWW